MNAPDKLVIFDYSGTLSIAAPRFAAPARLARELAASGLAALGVATPEIFWGQIVNPTWTEGSTTRCGYARVMADRIASLGLAPAASRTVIAAAANRFVESYLAHSSIDLRWHPLLSRLADDPAVATVVATDHYAEATAAIHRFLGELGARLYVANSADLGVWKRERRFWEALRGQLPLTAVRRILLIDDFGLQEEQGDSYGGRQQALSRQQKTTEMLSETFGVETESIPFFLEAPQEGDREAEARLIAATMARIEAFLEEP